jgi:hypothetical protein
MFHQVTKKAEIWLVVYLVINSVNLKNLSFLKINLTLIHHPPLNLNKEQEDISK